MGQGILSPAWGVLWDVLRERGFPRTTTGSACDTVFPMPVGSIDYAILALYFAFVLGFGFLIRRRVRSSEDFLTAHRSVPVWITSLAFLAADLGAQEAAGMCAPGAKYGLMTAHFYWLGAVPAMLFVGVFMLPFYYGSRAR